MISCEIGAPTGDMSYRRLGGVYGKTFSYWDPLKSIETKYLVSVCPYSTVQLSF
jgi:hypothetical protein